MQSEIGKKKVDNAQFFVFLVQKSGFIDNPIEISPNEPPTEVAIKIFLRSYELFLHRNTLVLVKKLRLYPLV